MNIGIVWFRQDLRLADNPALHAATQECDQIIPVFINETTGNSGLLPKESQASHVWLHHALASLKNDLAEKGATLILGQGDALAQLQALQQETSATHLYWNRRYDPVGIKTDTTIKQQLGETCTVHSFNGNLLSEPWTVLKKDDTPYRVFTAFWKAKQKIGFPDLPLPEPERIADIDKTLHSLTVDELNFIPALDWHQGVMDYWQVSETAAHTMLDDFIETHAAAYKEQRNLPAQTGTSRLSPYLHFGLVSPRQILLRAQTVLAGDPAAESGINCFLSEIGWREFAYYLLYHFPQTVDQPLDTRFDNFPWRQADDYAEDFQRWQQGRTGIPIVDAGMRELWATGWMHNRVRMIVASFLTKNLLIPWQEGERWFRDTLVDADVASNTMGWQWVAGCGADAAPYFRIFNPLLQGEKFDPDNAYIHHWVPEAKASNTHKNSAYVSPIIDLKHSRVRALDCFKTIKKT